MKKLYFLLALALIGLTTNAQIINFPDANFKAKLLEASPSNMIASTGIQQWVKIDTNDDGEIQESEALLITELRVSDANITDLTGIGYFTNLAGLTAQNNQLTTVDLSALSSSLTYLDLTHNQLYSISLNNLIELQQLRLNGNFLNTLDLSALVNLYALFASGNQLTSIIWPVIPNPYDGNTFNAIQADLSYNQFESLTFPARWIIGISCSNNPLTFLNIKESYYTYDVPFEEAYVFSDCPNLTYICARENQISNVLNAISIFGINNCQVNTYCSFTPGGVFYTLQNTTQLDTDSNGCDTNDPFIPNMKYTFTNSANNTTLISDGNSSINYVQNGTYTITPIMENESNYTISPTSATVTFPTAASPFIQNFCVSANSSLNDLEVALFPIGPARPGFDAEYKIIYKNKGTTVQNGTINLWYPDVVVDLVSTNPSVSSTGSNTLNWDFTNLQPFETRVISFTVNVNSPIETPPVLAGNILDYVATAIGATDETLNDNTATLLQSVVNSFDPNDKTCVEGQNLPINRVGEYVHYIIRFENTGTFAAENIVVKDIIDTTKFDIASLVPLNGSHSFYTRIINTNQIEFIFENINLPFDDANNDGYVAFKIKTKSTLLEGNTFSNAANIYFDYNAPIVTDTYTTTVFNPLNTTDFEFSNAYSLSPVPTKNILTITTKETVIISSISIYNTLGQVVQVITNPNETIDVSGLQSGSYFIKIISDKGSATGKFVKE